MSSAGKLVGIYLGAQRGASKAPQESAELVADHGVQGDCHAGTHPQYHVSLFAQEVLHAIQNEGFELTPGELSANLFTEGLSLDSLTPGTQICIGTAIIEIVKARKPCHSITRISNRLPKRLYGQCGQLARVIQGGTVQVGVEIILLQPANELSWKANQAS
jgi:MOSC domain-containing protein YiiM